MPPSRTTRPCSCINPSATGPGAEGHPQGSSGAMPQSQQHLVSSAPWDESKGMPLRSLCHGQPHGQRLPTWEAMATSSPFKEREPRPCQISARPSPHPPRAEARPPAGLTCGIVTFYF